MLEGGIFHIQHAQIGNSEPNLWFGKVREILKGVGTTKLTCRSNGELMTDRVAEKGRIDGVSDTLHGLANCFESLYAQRAIV